ncbi:MAG: 30S ribosomal protein S15 [Thermodesulfobacteriota bacterium]
MALDKDDRAQIINEFAVHDKDVGSPEVQVGILSRRIADLTVHMSNAPKDFHSRRGLVLLVARRRRLLNYIKKNSPEKYPGLIKRLGLRK